MGEFEKGDEASSYFAKTGVAGEDDDASKILLRCL